MRHLQYVKRAFGKGIRPGGAAGIMLNAQEREFAAENHHIVGEYLRMRRLLEDEWYDVAFGYTRKCLCNSEGRSVRAP